MAWNYEYPAAPPAPPAERPEPPEPPAGELPDPAAFPRWPIWAPVVAIAIGFLATGLFISVVGAAGVKTEGETPVLTVVTQLVFDVLVVGASVFLAAQTARLRPWHFGLRPSRLGYTVAIAAGGVAAFYLFAFAYGAIVQPDNPQRVVEELGSDESTTLLIASGLLVIAAVPVCEELFFRAFVFRVLRSRLPFWPAAVVTGLLFGAVHGINVVVPILIVLGVVLCWVYERTGTIYAPIAIHAFNNTLAFGFATEDGWPASLTIGGLTIAACAVALTRPARSAPAAA
jgi:membrane protease YdiL (CAAX protease family)